MSGRPPSLCVVNFDGVRHLAKAPDAAQPHAQFAEILALETPRPTTVLSCCVRAIRDPAQGVVDAGSSVFPERRLRQSHARRGRAHTAPRERTVG
jgi:hypothetical protein